MPIQNLLCNSITCITEEYFNRTERVFSYELYHTFKIQLNNSNQFINNIVLDAELPKRILSDEGAATLGLVSLGSLMSPDIILHERDTANHQLLVAEIKAEKYLAKKSLIKDINKLISFKMNYNFQNAIFIAINCNMVKVEHHLRNAIIIQGHNISQIANDTTIVIPDNIDINIITKKSANEPLEQSTLRTILNIP